MKERLEEIKTEGKGPVGRLGSDPDKIGPGRPGGQAVKRARSTAVAWASPVRISGAHRCTAWHAILWQHPIQIGGRWARMLARGQSSSAKKEEDWQMLAQG